ncbi:glycosyltransferase family 2 protein, partial [Candidatus Omnitrophota bacterium]
NTRNLLFCKAYNQGIAASKGNFILCLNNDCFLDKDYLREAINAIGIDRKIGAVSGKILRMDKKTIDSTGLFLGRNRKPAERGYGKKDKGQYEERGYIFGVSGACAFFRRSMLMDVKDEHGYFDERFGMYYEDLDLCWRAQKKGWKAYYNPKAIAYHVRGGTAISKGGRRGGLNLPYLSDELKKRYLNNRYMCMKKNDSLCGFLVNLPFILWYEIKIRCYLVVSRIRRAS